MRGADAMQEGPLTVAKLDDFAPVVTRCAGSGCR
jgi:hypothetical protein